MASIRSLKTLIAIADTGSFAGAALRVSLTPAAVGAQMKALEDEMNRPLFVRHSKGAAMTPAGAHVLQGARRLVAQYEDMLAADRSADQVAGSLVVGSITSAMGLLAASVLALKAQHPALEITLVHGRADDLRNRVLSGEMDAAVYVETPGKPPPATLWQHLYREPLMLVCSAQAAPARAAAGSAIKLLRTQPFIRFDHTAPTADKIGQILKRVRVQPQVVLEMNSVTSIVELVRQNIGIAIVPVLHSFDWHRDPALRLLPIPGQRFERSVGMLQSLRRMHMTQVLQDHLLRQIALRAAP